jgi:hypothetical protein
MKRYITSSTNDSKYIGGRLYDLPDSYWDDEDGEFRTNRYEEQEQYIHNFADFYIIYRPDNDYAKFAFVGNDITILYYLTESMAIKDGIDVYATSDCIEVIAYYGSYKEVAYLYPISTEKAGELADILENAYFNESTILETEIAQYCWNGASVADVLRSWA